MTVGVHEAKTRLSELLRVVEDGEEVVVTRGGEAVARLVPVERQKPSRRRFGALTGQVGETGDWDEDDADEWGDRFGLPRV